MSQTSREIVNVALFTEGDNDEGGEDEFSFFLLRATARVEARGTNVSWSHVAAILLSFVRSTRSRCLDDEWRRLC